MQEIGCAENVCVDDVTNLCKFLVEKVVAETPSGISHQHIHRSPAASCNQFVDTVSRGEIGIDGLDVCGTVFLHDRLRSVLNGRLIRSDQKVVAVPRAAAGEFKAYSCRGTGDDREFIGDARLLQ